ncbi:YncE family protein [Saccharopolyspora sp. 5N102]|uniref:YncE family protein n=1 Tax=Saccharopolyspora sp. 5N102 TaxID=3375155 RepID=UPI0037A5571A
MRRLAIICLSAALLTGCGMDTTSDPLQVTDTLTAATPATAPPATTPPAGTVHPAAPVQHAAYDRDTHTLVLASGPQLTLVDTRTNTPRTLTLPSTPATLRTERGQLTAALPDTNLISRIDLRTATAQPTQVPGGPIDAIDLDGDRTAVILRDTGTVTVLHNGTPTATTEKFQGPAQLLPTRGGIAVLDRLATAITPIDPATGSKGAGLRAGQGATNAITDRYGRILTIDTRGQELLAFSTDPLIMKQRYPVPGAPYGLAYDPTRDLAWITLTATNELVGYDIAGGEPQERHRLPTISQPNAVAVDPDTGDVYIASANGAGYQVVRA